MEWKIPVIWPGFLFDIDGPGEHEVPGIRSRNGGQVLAVSFSALSGSSAARAAHRCAWLEVFIGFEIERRPHGASLAVASS
ncbi:MAG: hypothetical protein ACN6QH_24880, partial [Pseudomonas sp.]|uniref:hypothetical protein n=1 Tax=Pseudomonas sp. TaxID=306 RepID=UPI003D098494